MKPAQRMIAPRGQKGVARNIRLLRQIRHEPVERIARLRRGVVPAEVAHGLKMHAAHGGHVIARKADDLAEGVVVHAGDDRRHERDAEAERIADADGLRLFAQQRRAAQGLINPIVHPVELQEDDIEPRLGKARGIVRVAREAQAVRVQLHGAAAGLFGKADEAGQIVAQRRLAARKLQQHRAAFLHDVRDRGFQRLRARIVLRRAAVGKAEAAAQIAPARDLEQHAAGAGGMCRAETAVFGACKPLPRRHRRLREQPRIKIHLPLPDQRAEGAVVGAGFFQKDAPVVLAAERRGEIFETDRADGARGADHLSHVTPPCRSIPACAP